MMQQNAFQILKLKKKTKKLRENCNVVVAFLFDPKSVPKGAQMGDGKRGKAMEMFNKQ